MSDFPSKAKVVIIGAGIVGNSLVYHMALKGWTDMVLLDKGPFPNPGGSTGHASNFIFPVDHSKEMALITHDSMKQYKELGVFTECGGIEVARTEERMQELTRRMSSSKAWGVESELISPARIKELVPYIDESILLGGFYTPSVGVVDSLRAGTIMREYAQDKGASVSFANTEITDLDVKGGRVTGVHTTRGHIEAEMVIVCCGCWSPRIAAMAGATIPLVPAVHQMISVGPIPFLEETTTTEIEYPIVRDMDTFMYERQNGNDMEVGSYAHRAILMHPDDIPSVEEAAMSPTEMPFTEEDFEPQLEHSLELMPEILGDESVGVRHAINGLLSLTPDGGPCIGETEVKGLWSVAAIWIKEAPSFAKAAAEMMTDGWSEIDIHAADIARFYPYARTEHHVNARTSEGFIKTYGIVHPREQWESNRNVRVSPFFSREEKLGAVFFETAGWERPQWYESNARLVEEFGDKVTQRPHEWDARWWSPIINAEHLAMRDRGAMVDLSAFAIFDVSGPGVVPYIQKMAMNQMNVKVGRAVYTPILAENGGFRSDLTILRLARDKYRIITGGGDGARDKAWFTVNLPEDGSVNLDDQTAGTCTIGLWGPKVRDVLQSVTDDDVSNEGLPYNSVKNLIIAGIPAMAFRISYVGELGWEITTSTEHGPKLWDTLWEAGRPYDIVPAGIGVYGTTGRLEKGYRLMSAELETEYSPIECGLDRPKVKKADFIGKEAYIKAREAGPAAILCTLTVDDHTSKAGVKRYMQGSEPIVNPADGKVLVDSHGRPSYVTSAGAGPSLGKYLLLAYLPVDQAVEGNKLAVEYMAEQYPVTVARVGSQPLFDPNDDRMKV